MPTNFHDDPRPLIAELDDAFSQYSSDFDALVKQVLASITSSRWATDDMFPSHPLFGIADIRIGEPWGSFDSHWLRDGESTINPAWLHGFDSQGRIVLAKNELWGHVYFWGTDTCDQLQIYESTREKGRFIWGADFERRLILRRLWYGESGRIECVCEYTDDGDRSFEWFYYEGKRCIESVQQYFEIITKDAQATVEKTEDELCAEYRPLQGNELFYNLVEIMPFRTRIHYSYSPSGELLKAEEFNAAGEPEERLLFEKLSERSLEETVESLAVKVGNSIEKAAKKRSTAKPYRGLVLIYSAEHAHCGLPHEVSSVGFETQWPVEKFNQEHYSNQLDFEFKRSAWKLLVEFNQRCYARFAFDDSSAQTAAAVTVMRKIAEHLHSALSGTKHVTEDFIILVIDDHGDVSPFAVPS